MPAGCASSWAAFQKTSAATTRGPEKACWTSTPSRSLTNAFDDSGDLIIDGDRVVAGHHVVQRARLKVDSLKWICSRIFPKRYGDKMEMLGQGEQSQTIKIAWQATDAPTPPIEKKPPRQLTYKPLEMPADLSPADWSILMKCPRADQARDPVELRQPARRGVRRDPQGPDGAFP
jgi:hypothetical protein